MTQAETAAEADKALAKKSRLRRDVQGLRAIAVLMVVLYHAGADVPGGFTGVDVFFVISGFVIGGLLLDELRSSGRISLRTFYARRARRIIPAAGLMTLTTLLLVVAFVSPISPLQGSSARAGVAGSSFVANFWFMFNTGGYYDTKAVNNPFLHMWSLSVEEQFYLLFPLLLVVIWAIAAGRPRRVAALLLVPIALSVWLSVHYLNLGDQESQIKLGWLNLRTTAEQVAFFSPQTRAWEFLLGVVTCVIVRKAHRIPGGLLTACSWIAIPLLGMSAFWINDDMAFPGLLALIPTLGAAMLILGGSGTRTSAVNLPTHLLSLPPFVKLGNVSYSWYLWHWPLLVIAFMWIPRTATSGVLISILALLPAVLSYRYVENPIRNRTKFGSRRGLAALVFGFMAVPIVVGLGVNYAASNGWWNPRYQEIKQILAESPVPEAQEPCDIKRVSMPTDGELPPCVWRVPDTKGTILLIGDSHAAQYAYPVVQAGNELGYDVQVSWARYCPMIRKSSYVVSECQRLVEDAFATLKNSEYAAIVFSQSSAQSIYSERAALAELDIEPNGTAIDKSYRGWVRGLQDFVNNSRSGQPFLMIGDNPAVGGLPLTQLPPWCLAPAIVVTPVAGCGEVDGQRENLWAKARETTFPSTIRYKPESPFWILDVSFVTTTALVTLSVTGCQCS